MKRAKPKYRIEPCRDPLRLWMLIYPNGARQYFASRNEARAKLREIRREIAS